VPPYEYSMFIEHLGALIYRSLWSEMLDDLKFFFPIKPRSPRWLHSHWAALPQYAIVPPLTRTLRQGGDSDS